MTQGTSRRLLMIDTLSKLFGRRFLHILNILDLIRLYIGAHSITSCYLLLRYILT